MRASNEKKFKLVYERYYDVSLAWLRRQGLDSERARELAQDAFSTVFNGLNQLKGDDHESWILGVVRRTYLNEVRARRAYKKPAGDFRAESNPEQDRIASASSLEKLLQEKKVASLRSALQLLSTGERQVLLLRILDDLTYREISKILEMPVHTVKSRFRSAMRNLKRVLEEKGFWFAEDLEGAGLPPVELSDIENLFTSRGLAEDTIDSPISVFRISGGIGDSGSPPSPEVSSSGQGPFVRFLQARFQDVVGLGREVTLQARIGVTPGLNRSAELKPLDIPRDGLRVRLVVHNPGFERLSSDEHLVDVPYDADSDWVPYRLRAVAEGFHTLVVSCYAPGGYVGELEIDVVVEKEARDSPGREHACPIHDRWLDSGEVTLQVFKDSETYRFQLIDGTLDLEKPRSSPPLRSTPREKIQDLISRLNSAARGELGYSPRQAGRWLRNEGIQLWNEFIPTPLQERFWQKQRDIRRLYIRSDEDLVPWELLYPLDPKNNKDEGFLAEQFPVVHWPFGTPPTKRLQLSNACFVNPSGSPQRAWDEIEQIRRQLRAHGCRNEEVIGDLDSLMGAFDKADFDLLHFACHNSFGHSDPGKIRINLGGVPFSPVFLTEHQGRFEGRSPLVFLNACRTKSEEPIYAEPWGWATKFLSAGAGGFVGTLWEVRDETARQFAATFYDKLLRTPHSLGSAFQAARMSIKDVPGDPTWLAYTLYGDPCAELASSG